MFTVGDLKDSVSGLLQGINLDNVTNINGLLESAARILVQKVDVPEASDKQSITLYNGVYDYLAPTSIFGGALTDFRPQGVSRSITDEVYRQPIKLFDRTKTITPSGYSLAFEHDKGTPLVRVSSSRPTQRTTLDPMNSTTGWTAAGSASGLTVDETVFYESPASLRFLLTGASTGTLTKAINSLNISSYEDVCVGFLAMRTPSVDDLTSIALKVGSASTDYDEVSTTTGFLGAWVVDEFLLVAFDFSTATPTGTPDWTAIDYVQVSVTHSDTITNFRVGGLWLSLPSPHEIHFQTPYIFLSGGSLIQKISDDTDQIILNDSAYSLYQYQSAVTISKSSGGSTTAKTYEDMLTNELYPMYRADNPSQEIRETGSYYDELG